MRRVAAALAAAAVLVTAVLIGGRLLLAPDPEPTPKAVDPVAPPPPAAPILPGSTIAKQDPCVAQSDDEFEPTSITVVGERATVSTVARDGRGVPGTPPTTTSGKQTFAWDPALLPGATEGNVLINAHTWPDGSALGNRLLDGLQLKSRLVVSGAGEARACFRVTERFEVRATDRVLDYYATDGPHQVAIVVCSGVRRGPGDWTHRTIWYAERVT